MQNSDNIIIAFKQLGRHIQNLREERNISIKELAEITGIRKEYLKKVEKGNAYGVMLNTHFVKIAKALKVNLSNFFDY